MNKLIMTAIAASIALATPVFANDAHHPEKKPANSVAPVQPAAILEQEVKQMQYNVKKMLGQLNRIANAASDEERQTAMAEHMQTLQENMHIAHGMQAGMMNCPMMGKGGMGKMSGGMMGNNMGMMGNGTQPGGSADRMRQMEKRMDMMQMRMEQMGRSQGGTAAPTMPMMK